MIEADDQARDDDSNGYSYGSDDGGLSAGGGAVADTGGVGPPPRHDFVAKLVRDPANLAAEDGLAILTGWVGDSDEKGYTRVYCELTLDCYADVRDEDIIHHGQAPDVCGTVIWARRDAKVRYGRRGEGKKEASSFFAGPLLQDYRGTGASGTGGSGGTGQQGGAHITLLTVAGICPTANAFCLPTLVCLPPSIGCPPQQGVGAAQNVGVTGWYGCGQHTSAMGCPNTSTCTPQTHMLGCPSTSTCTPHTNMPGCPSSSTCTPQTHMLGCPSSSTCPPQGGAQAEAAGGQQTTIATVCTQIHCPTQYGPATVCTHPQFCPHTHLLGCPSSSTCPPQGAAAGAGPQTYNPGCTLGFTCTYVGCPPHGTAATVCTQTCPRGNTYNPGCTLGFTCTYVGCPQQG